ncbi:hypothetical protein [Halorhodospira sp. 9628]|uniref:hypothetical protein n=1 Tax=Halorhodospira sp. 9628 TaxID=2899137 RepID=UPI001EE958D2|nr:hypothetical protein [Halorhodospira sp. 9628]MCG5528005.1 hypothetical protein [Halorhodospira halophila]MCG5542125.1 hypothetical protein [Halorhodospira sp. 9628]
MALPNYLTHAAHKSRTLFNRALFTQYKKQILHTPPLHCARTSDTLILSMIGSSSFLEYLIAIKSFLRFTSSFSVEVISDGTLDREHVDLLQTHIPNIRFSSPDAVKLGPCPRGGTWERLLRVVELTGSHYVIQMDSDIIVAQQPGEVFSFLRDQKPFAIGNRKWPAPVSLHHMAETSRSWHQKRGWKTSHIQPYCESLLDHLPDRLPCAPKGYLRACSGFCGYPEGSLSFYHTYSLSEAMRELVGWDRWRQWGSEQVMSNLLLGGMDAASALPWPEYQNFMEPRTDQTGKVIHFIGAHRHKTLDYLLTSRALLKELNKQQKAKTKRR